MSQPGYNRQPNRRSGYPSEQPGYRQPPYQFSGYPSEQPGYPTRQHSSAAYLEGVKYKEKALIYGILGFFFLGIVFGPLAIINANRAEALHHSATIGKVLGWVDVISAAISIIVIVFLFLLIATSESSGYGV